LLVLAVPEPGVLSWQVSFDPPSQEARALAVYGGKLYATGNDQPVTRGELYVYDGATWVALNFAGRTGTTFGSLPALEVFDGKLYIGALSDWAAPGGKVARIYSYDGTAFAEEFSLPGDHAYTGVPDLAAHEGALYAAVNTSATGAVYRRHASGAWDLLGALPQDNVALSVASHKGSLYAGTGLHPTPPGMGARVWRWTGAAWSLVKDLNAEFGPDLTVVNGLVSYDGTLWAAVGGNWTARIIDFDGANWTVSLEFPGNSTNWLSQAGDSLWAGGYLGQAFRRQGGGWARTEPAGDSNVMSFARYGGFVYAATDTAGAIYRTVQPAR
jgi:hypothetical protein